MPEIALAHLAGEPDAAALPSVDTSPREVVGHPQRFRRSQRMFGELYAVVTADLAAERR